MTLSAAEQYLLELINRARLDPEAEADRYDLSLNDGLDAGTISGDALQVLAPSSELEAAATAHSEWMLSADTFSHTGQNGSSAGDRMANLGYDFVGEWKWCENLAWAGTTGTIDLADAIENHHEGLYRSSGHRANTFDTDIFEVGLGQVEGMFTQNGQTYSSSMLTQNFAASGGSAFITGVAYRDTDGDDFYSIGEGRSDVWFKIDGDKTNVSSAGGYGVDAGSDNTVDVTVGTGNSTLGSLSINMTQGNAKLDLVTMQDGSEVLFLSGSANLYSGLTEAQLLGTANLSLKGTSDRDVLTGNAGENVINGEKSSDKIAGKDGTDSLSGGEGNDNITGGKGQDTIWGGKGQDELKGGKGQDELKGGDGSDKIWGGTGSDEIYGGKHADTLKGGSGSDLLNGGKGNDKLTGGAGADTFVFKVGADRIFDFANDQDTILIGSDLVGGAHVTTAEVLAMGQIIDGNAVFDFGDGNSLQIDDVTNLSVLENDLFVV